jgi:sugar lactone lactonase YvrE
MRGPLRVAHAAIVMLAIAFVSCGGRVRYESGRATLAAAAESDILWTGVAVSEEGRIFVNYPRWSPDVAISVAELTNSGGAKAFPNAEWNRWEEGLPQHERFVCVQSVYIDRNDDLWVLDAGNPLLEGVVEGGPKLVKIDLGTNEIIRVIRFDGPVIQQMSYLNDVRVDVESGHAFITDSGVGAILVVDLETGGARRVLYEHPSTKAEDITLMIEGNEYGIRVNADGIALSPDRKHLYYQALSGRTLYRIETKWLRDASLSESEIGSKVERIAETGVSDGIEFDRDGNLYLTSIEHNAVRRYTPEGKVEIVVTSPELKWPDSFSIERGGTIFVSVSQLHLGPGHTEPYRIYRLVPE